MKKEPVKPLSGLAVGEIAVRQLRNWRLVARALRQRQSLRQVVQLARGGVASALLGGKNGITILFKLSFSAIFFSFGVLRVAGLVTLHLLGNLLIAIAAPVLIFAPAHAVLALMFLAVCFLFFSTQEY